MRALDRLMAVDWANQDLSLDHMNYSFGSDFENFSRTLTITKDSKRYTPVDGAEDRAFRKATWGIAARFSQSGEWPERGSHTSG